MDIGFPTDTDNNGRRAAISWCWINRPQLPIGCTRLPNEQYYLGTNFELDMRPTTTLRCLGLLLVHILDNLSRVFITFSAGGVKRAFSETERLVDLICNPLPSLSAQEGCVRCSMYVCMYVCGPNKAKQRNLTP
jgi:hypothetical protein